MPVASLKFLQAFRRYDVEIFKRSGGAQAILDYSNKFILTLLGILNP